MTFSKKKLFPLVFIFYFTSNIFPPFLPFFLGLQINDIAFCILSTYFQIPAHVSSLVCLSFRGKNNILYVEVIR